jgi:hypothetical protein
VVQPESQWIGTHEETADSLGFVGMAFDSIVMEAARQGVKTLRVLAGDLSTEDRNAATAAGVDLVQLDGGAITLERRRGKSRLNLILEGGMATRAAFF